MTFARNVCKGLSKHFCKSENKMSSPSYIKFSSGIFRLEPHCSLEFLTNMQCMAWHFVLMAI